MKCCVAAWIMARTRGSRSRRATLWTTFLKNTWEMIEGTSKSKIGFPHLIFVYMLFLPFLL